MSFRPTLIAMLITFGGSSLAHASLVDLNASSFNSNASLITFSEANVPLGTTNPSYVENVKGIGAVTVSFDGIFKGQTTKFINNGGVQTLDKTTPSGPLSLNTSGPVTFTSQDGAMPTEPVLSGTPQFNGPISILFSKPVAAVGLIGGYFDTANSTTIEAFDPTGKSLGSITNPTTGDVFFGLANSTGAMDISGVSFYVTGNEPAGFDIDNVTFGTAAAINISPEPSSFLLIGLGAAGVALGVGRKRSLAHRPTCASSRLR